MKTRRLSDQQTEHFDQSHSLSHEWEPFSKLIRKGVENGDIPEASRFLDIGGGKGVFTDALLREFPRFRGTLVDINQKVLDSNQPHPNKDLLVAGIDSDLPAKLGRHSFDLVFFNLMLHHLVGDTYRATVRNQRQALQITKELLKPAGILGVCEIAYNGWIDDLPGFLIYQLTSVRSLSALTRSLGANTAGVGVAFHSKRSWLKMIDEVGFSPVSYLPTLDGERSWKNRLLLTRHAECGIFWCTPSRSL